MNRRAGIGLAALVMFAGAAAADRFAPAESRPAARIAPLDPGGVLACPFFGAGNGRSWLHVANIGSASSKVTITTVRQGAAPLTRTLTLAAGRTLAHTLDPATRQPSGAIVSYAGSEVIASRTSLVTVEGHSGGVAAPCSAASGQTLVTATGSTLKAETTLYLLNASSSDAVASILFVAGGIETEPQSVQGIVVPRRSIRRVRVGDFVFDQRNAAAIVRVRTGVLAADALLSSERGISLTALTPPSDALSGVGAADAGGGIVDLLAMGEADSVTEASLLTQEGQSALAALPPSLEPAFPQSFGLGSDKSPALAAVVNLSDGPPLAGGYRWIVQLPNGRGDVAGVTLRAPGRRMAAVIGEPASPSQTRLMLANPSDRVVRVRLRLLGPAGPLPLEEVTLQPGASVKREVGSGKGPVAVVAEAEVPIMAALGSTVAPREVNAFAVEALPARDARSVEIATDPRLGVPAP